MKKRVIAIILALAMMLNGNIVMAAETQSSVKEETVVESTEEQEITDQAEPTLEEDGDDTVENLDEAEIEETETEIKDKAEEESVPAENETEPETSEEETQNSLSEEIETENPESETNTVLGSAAQTVDTNVPDYNIWMANTLLYGYQNDKSSSLYQMFQDFQDPVYEELGGYLLEDEPLINMSAEWSTLLNEEYRGQLTEKYIYEILLTDYLLYDANSTSTTIDLDNKELDFSMQMYSLLVKELDNNAYDYIKNLTVEEAINFYDNVGTAVDIDFALKEVKKYEGTLKDVQEVINLMSECLALQQAQEERILLLKEARNACAALDSPNTEFIAAADGLISALEGSPIEYVAGRSTSYILKKSIDSAWEILCDGNPTLKVVSTSIELGVSGMDALFDTTNNTSNNLKLALLYTLDSYMKLGMMNATADFMSSNTQENAKTYIGCFQAYVQFQMCGNDYSTGWLEDCIDDKSLSGLIKQIFLRDNISTGKELIARVKSQNVNRKNLLQLMSKYAGIYQNLYSEEGWEEFIGQIPVTGISFSQSEMTLYNPDSDIYVAYAEVMPANATNKNVTYTSSNPEILSVPDSGGFGSIKGTGTVVITATAEDGGFTATQTVHVGGSTAPDTPSEEIDSGQCGDDVYWKLYKDGTLEIYGNGGMDDYYLNKKKPWREERNQITKIVIGNNVTAIGGYSFSQLKNLTKIELPEGVSIGESAFAGCEKLIEINFPDGVSIGNYAFADCIGLKEIELPDQLERIGDYAFDGCIGLKEIELPDDVPIGEGAFSACMGLTKIGLPDNWENVGAYVFAYCTGLKNIEFPNNWEYISERAFAGCSGLEDIEFSDQLKSIGDCAFRDCTGLENIEFPVHLKSIGASAFERCEGLTEIKLPDSVSSIGDYAFYGCLRLKKIEFSDQLKSIGGCAFRDCTGLTEIALPDSVRSIGSRVFWRCTSLMEVKLSKQLESVGDYAFQNCTGLKKVIIYSKVKEIGFHSFSANCPKICLYVEENSYAHQFAKEHRIKYQLLDSNANRMEILKIGAQTWGYNQLKVSWDSVNDADGYRIYYAASAKGTFKYLDQLNGASTTSYYHKGLTTGKTYYYKVRAYQKVNGKYVFGEYSDVISAKPLPKTVNVTKAESFGCNTKLTWDKVNGANGYRLYYYTPENSKYQYITQITSGSTTSYIHSNLKAGQTYCYKIRAYRTVNGEKVFGGYSAVKKVTPSLTGMKLTKAQTWGYNQVKITWEPVTGAQGYRIYYASSRNGSYKYVTQVSGSNNSYIHKKLTTGKTYYYKVRAYQKFNGKYIFGEYASPISAKPLPKQVKINTITASGTNAAKLTWGTVTGASGYRIYYREVGAQEWKYVAQIGKGNTLTYTHKGLVAGKSYEYKMRAYRTVNGKKVFGAYSALKVVSTGENGGSFSIRDGVLTGYRGTSENVVIPSGITAIGSGAFANNKNIKSVVIPEGVTEIGWNAFMDCTSLSSVTFPDSVESIVTGAFDNTAWLDIQRRKNPLVIVNDILLDGKTASGDVTIPYGIKTIGYYAFCPDPIVGESKITSIQMPDSVEKIEMFAFGECSSLEWVTVSENLKLIGENAFLGCNSLVEIGFPDSLNSIGISAFRDCSSLTYININIARVEEATFANCTNLTYVDIGPEVTYIENEAFANCPIEKISGLEDSYAQSYAEAHNIPFYIVY